MAALANERIKNTIHLPSEAFDEVVTFTLSIFSIILLQLAEMKRLGQWRLCVVPLREAVHIKVFQDGTRVMPRA